MSLMSVRGRAAVGEIDPLKVANREMPPWGADPQFGTFKDDRSLSARTDRHDRADGSTPARRKGATPTCRRLPTFASGWSHGEPDVVIEMPVDFEIPAEGEVPVIDFFASSPFTAGRLREGARSARRARPASCITPDST